MAERVKDDEYLPEPKPRFNPLAKGPDRREPTWGDYGSAATIGARGVVSGAAAAGRLIGEEFNLPGVVANNKAWQKWALTENEKTAKEMTPSARARLEAAITDDEFTGNIMSSLGLKLTATAPSVVAAAIPATVFSGALAVTAAATGLSAALNTSQLVDEMYRQTDEMDDEELQQQSSAYAKLRESMDEMEAREEFNGIVRGMTPFYVAAASVLTGAFGPAAQTARALTGSAAGVARRGGIKGVTGAAAEGAASEFIEEGATQYGQEAARVATGERVTLDREQVVLGAIEGAVLGGTIGGAAGVGTIGRERPRLRENNPAQLPSANPTPAKINPHQANTATPSTAPAIVPPPVSPNANPKTEATPAAPSAVTPATVPVAPRKRPPRAATGLTPEVVAVETTPAPVPVAPVNPIGLDAAIETALAPTVQGPPSPAAPAPAAVSAPASAAPRQRPVIKPRIAQPPGTIPTALGPGVPAPVQVDAVTTPVAPAVTPVGNDTAVPPVPSGGPEPARPAAQTVAPPSSAVARAPRILADVRPEIVEMNRDDAFQQREALLENQRAIRREEAGPAGRTDLYGKAGEKRKADAKAARELFQERVPEQDVIPVKPDQQAALKARVDGIVADAKARGITIPTKIDYEGTSPTADHLVWLREVADMQKAFAGAKPPSLRRIQTFLIRERAAKAGDWDIMKSERRAEGDQAKRGAQADVETIADPKKMVAAIDSEGDTTAAPVASAANAEADAVPTVASKIKRGAVRDAKSEEKAGSAVRKIELSDEEKKAYAAKLLGDVQVKDKLAGRVVDDAKFTKEVAAKASAPPAVEKAVATAKARETQVPVTKVPPKVTALKAKVAAAAKRVEREPSKAKIDANNFTKGPVNIQGLPVVIETPRGAVRRGTTPDGREWEVKMPAHYGEIKRTEGADGDPLDVYIGSNPSSDYVLVIEQNDARTGQFDELKSFIGYPGMREALGDYMDSFSDKKGAQRFGEFRNMTMAEFKEFTKTVQTKKRLDAQQVLEEAKADAGTGPDGVLPSTISDYMELATLFDETPQVLQELSIGAAFDAIDMSYMPSSMRPFMVSLKAKLRAALEGTDVKVEVVTDEKYTQLVGERLARTSGVYDNNVDAVFIPERTAANPKRMSYVMMHELGHAATAMRMMEEYKYLNHLRATGRTDDEIADVADNTGFGQVGRLLAFVKDVVTERGSDPLDPVFLPDHSRQYGLTNEFEFIAEALSNPQFQDTLAAINIPPQLAKLLQMDAATKVSGWRALMDVIRRMLGLTPREFTAFEGALSLSERLTYGSRQPEMANAYNTALVTGEPVERVAAKRAAQEQRYRDRNFAPPDGLDNALLPSQISESITRAANTVAGSRSFGDPKWLRMRSMTDMASLAKDYFRGNSVRRVVNAIEAIRVSGGEKAREAEPILTDMINAQRKYKGTKAFEELTTVMHDATMSGAHPDRSLEENTQLGKKSMKGFWGRAQHAALQQRYNALPADLKAVYQKSLKYFQDQHNAMIRQSLENRVLKALGINDSALADRIFNDKVTEADKELLGDMYEVVVEPGDFRKATGPYFPLKRFGQFVVRGTYEMQAPSTAHRQIDENTFEFDSQQAAEAFVGQSKNHTTLNSVYVDEATGSLYFIDDEGKEVRVHKDDVDAVRRWRVRVQNKHLEFFENRNEAEARREELTAEGVKMEPVVVRRDDPRQAQTDLLSTHMERLVRKVEARDAFKEMSETQQNEVRRAIEQASYAQLSSTRIQTSRIQRKYVEGASKDIVRSTAEYAGSMSGYLARYQHQGELDAALKEMNKEADTSGDPRTAMGRSTIRNEIMYRINQPNIAPSQHNSQWDQWRHRLLVTSFIGHLASPAYSLINATQPMMVTVPIVGARHGLGSTVAAMTKAYHDIGAVRSTVSGIVNTARRAGDAQADTNTYVADVLERISNPREKAMLNHLIKHGAIDADAGLEIGKLVDTSRGDQWLSYFEGISRQLPLAVESINRFATALTAYRLEMKRSNNHESAMLYAQEMVEQTQGIYAGTNAPPVFSSPIASIMFQFKKYGHLIYSLLGQQIGKAIRNTNPGDRAEAIKALGFIVGAHMAMAGTVGLPTEPIKLMIMGANALGLTGLTMEDFEEWEREQFASVFGSGAAEVMTHGLGRLAGMDLSGRMGMQSYLTFGAPDSSEEGDIWSFIGETVAGAPGGMVMDMTKGAQDIANGDPVTGMSKMVPVKVIKDGIKAYQMMTEGKTTKSGRQSLDPLSMPEAAMKLFGITPSRAAETQLAQGSYYRNTARLKEERLNWMYKWAGAKPAERQKLWKKVQAWNKEQPPETKLSYSQLSDYVRRRKQEEREGTVMGGMRVTDREKAIYERTQRLYNQ
jgi:inorganic pyrophosphatase